MGTGAILLVFYISPLIYADVSKVSSYKMPVYVPKTPREPMILVWPSVMNPDVAKNVAKNNIDQMEKHFLYMGRYMKVECHPQSVPEFNLSEVRNSLVWIDEIPRRLQFWNDLFPQLIEWLSREALDCGINTIFREARHEIYRFIDANRSNWVNALQEVVYILLQVIAVIQNKTGTFQSMAVYKDLDWLEQWDWSYEYWYTHTPDNQLELFQKFILNSLDIVIAWLVDYMGQRAGARQSLRTNFCSLLSRPDNCTFSFRPSFNVQTKWNLSEDPDIRCALRKRDLVPWREFPTLPFDWLLEALDPPDRIKAMAHSFMTCHYHGACMQILKDPTIWIGKYKGSLQDKYKGLVKILRLPKAETCTFTCTDLPKHFKYNAYALAHVTAEHLELYTLLHAYMTTAVAHDLTCRPNMHANRPKRTKPKIYGWCMHRIVDKFLYEREYKSCCKRKFSCCKRGDCEFVEHHIAFTDGKFKITSNITLSRRDQDFSDNITLQGLED